MNRLNRQAILVLFLTGFVLYGCQQSGGISVNSTSSAGKVSQTNTNPNTDANPGDNTRLPPTNGGEAPVIPSVPINYDGSNDVPNTIPDNSDGSNVVVATGYCADFISSVSPLVASATLDAHIAGRSTDVTVLVARDVKVTGNSGNITVKSSLSASDINGNSGRIFINSGDVGQIAGNSSKELCVNARSVRHLSGNSAHVTVIADSIGEITGGSGDVRVTADSIDSLTGNSSRIHIYRAVVAKLRGSSGLICLHDGAKILDMNGSNSSQIRTDCP